MDERLTPPFQEQQHDLLTGYLAEVYRWNARMNLTSVPEDEAWARHIDQSLRLSAALQGQSLTTVVDLGSGCGVPGIPLAVMHPSWELHLLESDRRKAGFLMNVAGILSLRNVTVMAERAEVVARDRARREAYDCVVSRATARAAVLVELALPLLSHGGVLAALVSDPHGDCQRSAEAARLCGGGVPRALDGILWVDKVTATDALYPRSADLMRRRALGE